MVLGVCISCWAGDAGGFASGEIAGLGVSGVCIVWGEAGDAGDAAGDGITIPGVCPTWPGAAGTAAGFADFGLRAAVFALGFRFALRLGVALGLGLLTFGIVCPSC